MPKIRQLVADLSLAAVGPDVDEVSLLAETSGSTGPGLGYDITTSPSPTKKAATEAKDLSVHNEHMMIFEIKQLVTDLQAFELDVTDGNVSRPPTPDKEEEQQ